MRGFYIRLALPSEKLNLEQLQMRASLANEGDRDALLAHPDAIQLPVEQIAGGRVFVSEYEGAIVGFAAIEPRADGESELDGLFVEPRMQRRGIAKSLIEHCAEVVRNLSRLFGLARRSLALKPRNGQNCAHQYAPEVFLPSLCDPCRIPQLSFFRLCL